MKYYCQLLNLSSGYVPNSLPPQFKEELKTPKEMLGSDAVLILDARNNLNTMIQDSEKRFNNIQKLKPSIVGFRVVRSSKFIDTDKEKNKRSIVYEYLEQD